MFICPYHSTDTCLFVPITPRIHVYLSLSLHRYMFICPYHSTDTCLFVPITPQIHVYLSLSLHRYMFICPYHSTDTCLFVRITPQIHVYLSISLHSYLFICPYHSTATCLSQLMADFITVCPLLCLYEESSQANVNFVICSRQVIIQDLFLLWHAIVEPLLYDHP